MCPTRISQTGGFDVQTKSFSCGWRNVSQSVCRHSTLGSLSRFLRFALFTLTVFLCSTPAARAEHADISLQVISPDGRANANADEEPPLGGRNKIPVLKVKAKDPLVMQYFLTNLYPHKVHKGVIVRYYVVPIETLRQKITPPLKDGFLMQGKVVMNFKPQCRVGARFHFRIPKPGLYRVRIDTLNTQSDHEHFSAIDLDVK
jgi:hypothetical protein